MPKRRKTTSTSHYEHSSASRSNLPTEESEPILDQAQKSPKPYEPRARRSEPPALAWDRETGIQSATSIAAPPLYISEKIHPGSFIQTLTREPSQPGLFDAFNGLPQGRERYEWYRHRGNWSNRLIHGESARVMASLLEREDLAGQVQMVFFDPPYGIGFNSNFQVSTRNLDRAADRPGSIPYDTRTIRAFRDTYERGIHSYLDQIREKLVLARDLLADSGSIFCQIGDENVHRMALVLDEVFGHENRVATIAFATSSSSSSRTLPSVADYLLWYVKDRSLVKFRQLYEPLTRAEIVKHFDWHAMVELQDGSERDLSSSEKADPDGLLPSGARIFGRSTLQSLGRSNTRTFDYLWNGNLWTCADTLHWRVSAQGLDHLAESNRLSAARTNSILRWKLYEDEVPGRKIHNLWFRQMSAFDKRYVVQTADSVIERCIQMTTDPGDLVLDPTCGGATTAAMAERWGRRWITCDTSPVAITIARQRLATSTHPYWILQDSFEGAAKEQELGGEPLARTEGFDVDPTHGFVYERVPKVSAAILAYDQEVDPISLVDRPFAARRVTRIASAFTVESESPHSYIPTDDHRDDSLTPTPIAHGEFLRRVVDALLATTVRSPRGGGEELQIVDCETWPGHAHSLVSHRVRFQAGAGDERTGTLCIAAEDSTVTEAMIRACAIESAARVPDATVAFVIGYAFEALSGEEEFGKLRVVRVNMNRDLQIGELTDSSTDHAFVMIGQPEISLSDHEDGRISVRLMGYDTFDPRTGNVSSGGPDDVACWMVDTNYDRISFFARRIHFPGAVDDRQVKKLKREIGPVLDKIAWDAAFSTESAPFNTPSTGVIAVKIVTTTGADMVAVKAIPGSITQESR